MKVIVGLIDGQVIDNNLLLLYNVVLFLLDFIHINSTYGTENTFYWYWYLVNNLPVYRSNA